MGWSGKGQGQVRERQWEVRGGGGRQQRKHEAKAEFLAAKVVGTQCKGGV